MPVTAVAPFTFAYWCVLVAALLPITCAVIAKSRKGFDNKDPRSWLAGQTGFRARANAAQSNSFENLAFFIGAVVIAHQLHAPQGRVDGLAGAYVVLRLAYVASYLADRDRLRSGIFCLAFLVNVALLFAGYR